MSDCLLTILMPCRNEEAALGQSIDDARRFLTRCGISGEILVVDNGSSDRSAAVAAENGGTEEGAYLGKKRRVVIVFSGLTVGNEAGDADLFERLEHCCLATADASCQSNVFHFIIIYWI